MKSRIVFSQIMALILVGLIFLSESYWEQHSRFVATVMFCLGLGLVGVASIGRMWCSLYIAGYKSNVLVTEGPYSMCRNPLYFFSLLGGIGVGLTTDTIFFPAVIVLFFALYYPYTIRKEEKNLFEQHAKNFSDYLKMTPVFFPKFSLLKEPSEYVVKPVLFRKHMIDAMWFVWLVVIMEVIEVLHQSHVIPVCFTIY